MNAEAQRVTKSRNSADPPLKISFCTTCKGRAHHVRQTLVANMAACADDPDVEFVLVDYQSDDGLREWVRENQSEAIKSGRVIYAYVPNKPFFHTAHAKNIAHRLATGDVLCNIDADNIIAPGYSRWLREQFTGQSNLMVAPRRYTAWDWISERIIERALGMRKAPAGLLGRIAVDRATFYRLGGYNEDFRGWGGDDVRFRMRLRDGGATIRVVPKSMWGDVLQHGGKERIANLSEADRQTSLKRLNQSLLSEFLATRRLVRARHVPVANCGRFGCAAVEVNFAKSPVVLGPLAGDPRSKE